MKWIKISIGVVIAVIMVGFIVTSVNSMTQERVKIVETTIIESGTVGEFYADPDVYDTVRNLYTNSNSYELFIDGINYTNEYYFSLEDGYISIEGTIETWGSDNVINDVYGITENGSTIRFEFAQAPQLTGTIAIILGLVPLIFAGGALAYMLNKQEF